MNEEKWFVVDLNRDGRKKRGPYKYSETAVAVREEMERNASDEQNERWNLGIIQEG